MLTRLLCELIPARRSYANSSLRCTKIEHTFLTVVLKVGSTIKIGHKKNWQEPKWAFGKRKTKTIKTDLHYNRSKYFLRVITSICLFLANVIILTCINNHKFHNRAKWNLDKVDAFTNVMLRTEPFPTEHGGRHILQLSEERWWRHLERYVVYKSCHFDS